jgi:hypothetical protein
MSLLLPAFFVSVTTSVIDAVADERYCGLRVEAVARDFELVVGFGKVNVNVEVVEPTGVPGTSACWPAAGSVPCDPPPPQALSTTVPARTSASEETERIRSMKVLNLVRFT